MEKPMSPLKRAQEDVSTSTFNEYISYLVTSTRQLINLTAEVARAGPGGITYETKSGKEKKVTMHDIKSVYLPVFVKQLNATKGIYRAKKSKRKSNGNSQLVKPFAVSHQLAAFCKDALPYLKNVSNLDVIIEDHVANGGILTSLFNRYIQDRGLRNKETGKFTYDALMKKHFKDTHFRDRKGKKISTDGVELSESAQRNVDNGGKSALERLSEKSLKNGESYVEDDQVDYKGLMSLTNYFRIPKNVGNQPSPELYPQVLKLQDELKQATKLYKASLEE